MLFHVYPDLGEIERFLILYMVRDAKLNAKDRKGRDFGNQLCSGGGNRRPRRPKAEGRRDDDCDCR